MIVLGVLKKELPTWKPRIQALIKEYPTATEDQIAWHLVREISAQAAKVLQPIFDQQHGKNGRLSIQTDPRLFRDSLAIFEQAVEFSKLAPNMIVKIPATAAGIDAIEEATYHGISINATVSFTLPQALAVGEAVERGLKRRESQGKEITSMGPVCTIMVGRLDDWLKVLSRKGQHCGRSRVPRMGGRRSVKESLSSLPRTRISNAIAFRGFSQPHALE